MRAYKGYDLPEWKPELEEEIRKKENGWEYIGQVDTAGIYYNYFTKEIATSQADIIGGANTIADAMDYIETLL